MNQQIAVTPPKAVLKSGAGIAAIIPTTIEEAFRLAEAVCIAGLVPDSLRGKNDQETASRVMITMLKGQEVGLPPMAALSNIYIINNKPSMYGDGALAVVQKHPQYAGHKEWYEGVEGQDSWISKCEFYRREVDGSITTYPGQFSWAQAKTANLTRRGPWVSYPGRMLKMRARAFGMRDGFSDALVGIAIAEEVMDTPTKPAEVATSFLDVETDAPNEAMEHPKTIIATDSATAHSSAAPEHPEGSVVSSVQSEPHAPTAEHAATSESSPVDSKALLQMIKKNFIQAGADKERIGQVIAAAEGLQLDEPYAAELAAIINAKKGKLDG